jgi:protein-L-isoaspartate(D-aspartate) O-methyltransferase
MSTLSLEQEDFFTKRHNMVESQIRTNAVTDARLLKALREVPREVFVPASMRNLAYMEAPLEVKRASDGHAARHLLAPMTFAKLAQLAEITSTDKLLDVGAATGYSTAIFAKLAGLVIAVECETDLAAQARDALSTLSIRNAKVIEGALETGAPDTGSYQVIFMNGRIAVKPDALFAQLASGGRLVVIEGNDIVAKARIYIKIDSAIRSSVEFDAAAPILSGFDPKPAFVF